jgi:hypothetical protein
MSAPTTRAVLRRVMTRSIALLAAATLAACANPTGPADLQSTNGTPSSNTAGGVIIGSSSLPTTPPTQAIPSGVIIGSSSLPTTPVARVTQSGVIIGSS